MAKRADGRCEGVHSNNCSDSGGFENAERRRHNEKEVVGAERLQLSYVHFYIYGSVSVRSARFLHSPFELTPGVPKPSNTVAFSASRSRRCPARGRLVSFEQFVKQPTCHTRTKSQLRTTFAEREVHTWIIRTLYLHQRKAFYAPPTYLVWRCKFWPSFSPWTAFFCCA